MDLTESQEQLEEKKEGIAASMRRKILEKMEWEEKGQISADQRAKEISEAVANTSDTSRLLGENVGRLLSDADKKLDKSDLFTEDELNRINSAENVRVRMEKLGEIVEGSRSRLLGAPEKNEKVGREREELQKKVIALTSALMEVGVEMMANEEKPDFESGLRALQYAKVSFDVNEPVWVTERIAAALDNLKLKNGDKLPDEVATSLAKANTWSAGLEVDANSGNVAKIAETIREATVQAENVRLAEEDRKFRETWETNREAESERYFGYSVAESRTMIDSLYFGSPQRFDMPGSQFIGAVCSERIKNANEYLEALAKVDDEKLAKGVDLIMERNVKEGIYKQDVAGRSVEDYKRYYGEEKGAEEFKKQFEMRIRREIQAHLLGMVLATYDRQAANGLRGNTILREMALKALGKGQMVEIFDGDHPDKFLTRMFHDSLGKNGDVKADFERDNNGVELVVRADESFKKDQVQIARNLEMEKDRQNQEKIKKEELVIKLEAQRKILEGIKSGIAEAEEMNRYLFELNYQDSGVYAESNIKHSIGDVGGRYKHIFFNVDEKLNRIKEEESRGDLPFERKAQIMVEKKLLETVAVALGSINEEKWKRFSRGGWLIKSVPQIALEAFTSRTEPGPIGYPDEVQRELTKLKGKEGVEGMIAKIDDLVQKKDEVVLVLLQNLLTQNDYPIKSMNGEMQRMKNTVLFKAMDLGNRVVKSDLRGNLENKKMVYYG